MFSVKDRALWESWNSKRGMNKTEAMEKFVSLALSIMDRNHILKWKLTDYYVNKTNYENCIENKIKNAPKEVAVKLRAQ